MYLLKRIIATFLNLGCCTLFAQVNTAPDTPGGIYHFQAVDTEASYPGGNEAWIKFLERNLNSNVANKNNAPIGKYTAYVLFIVDKDGSISNVKTQTNFGFGMEDEVIRVIEKSGKWNAAMQNGKPVKAYRKQPITFLLESDGFNVATQEPYTLYANADNEVLITVKKMKPADISISVPGAKSTPLGEGKFNIRVNKPGRITIEIMNNKKDDKEIGQASFEVKSK